MVFGDVALWEILRVRGRRGSDDGLGGFMAMQGHSKPGRGLS